MKTRSERIGAPRRARLLALLAGAAVSLGSGAALAGPQGAQVVRGDVRIQRQGGSTEITASHNAIINYRSFDIGPQESVRFIQPGARARVLNRVRGAEPTRIEGALLANGRVYLVNPAGVIFAPGSTIDVGGVFAAAGDIANSDFLRGVDHFTNVRGDVTIRGLITADAAHFVGRRIANHGTIVAENGVVTMSAGEDVLIGERGGNVYVRIDGASLSGGASGSDAGLAPASSASAAVENAGEVRAPGGQVHLGAGDAVSLAIRNSGRIVASGGEARLETPGGIENAGEIDASVRTGRAGSVALRGETIVHEGVIRADSDRGRAGSVEMVSNARTILNSGSIVSAAGGSGSASGGEILVHALGGDTRFERGAFVDLSGGALGGDAGFAEISAAINLHAAGDFDATAAHGALGTVLFDPRDIIIRDAVSATVGPDEFIDVATIETPGNVILEADRNFFVTTDVIKPAGTGSLTFRSGLDPGLGQGDVVLGEYPFGFILGDLTVQADSITLDAGRDILNNVALGATLIATQGDVSLTARTGNIAINRVETLTPGSTISWTQADSLAFSAAPGGLFSSPSDTNFNVNITDGFLRLGGDVDATQSVASLNATAADALMVEDPIVSGGAVNLRSGTDGTGNLTFLPGSSIASDQIALRAGSGGGSTAMVDAVGGGPSFFGAAGPGSRPMDLLIRQDASIGAGDLPGAAQFGDALSGMDYRLQSDQGGVAIGTASDVNGAALTLDSASGSTIDDDLTLESLTIVGPASLNADVETTQDQAYMGPVTLDGARTLTGDALTFQAPVDASSLGDASLTLGGAATFNNGVGAGAALAFLLADEVVAINGHGVTTTGDQTYLGDVALGSDATLRSLEDGTLRFASDLDGGFDLDLVTGEDGLIVFEGDVGQSDPLGALSLRTDAGDGMRAIPDRATIVGDPDDGTLMIDAERVEMGQNEKWTIFGDLDLFADQSVALGDLVTQGDMMVSAPTITLLRRQSADLLTSDGDLVADRGLDYVAGGAIVFDGDVVLGGDAGAPDPTFSNVSGASPSMSLSPFEVTEIDPERTTRAALTLGDAGVALDQRSVEPREEPPPTPPPGPGPGEIEASLITQEPQDPLIEDTVRPDPFDLALLNQIGVQARTPAPSEATTFLRRTIFVDLPPTPEQFPRVEALAATRFNVPAIRRVVSTYESIFDDAPAGEGDVAAAITASVQRYMSLEEAGDFRPEAYREYLASEPREAEALAYAQRLRDLLDTLRDIGLPEPEYVETRNRILAALVGPETPASAGELGEALEAPRATGGLGGPPAGAGAASGS